MPAKKTVAVTTRPVWPNAGVQAWYYAQLQRVLSEAQLDLSLTVHSAFTEAPPTIGFGADASPTKVIQSALDKWGKRWSKRFNRLSLKLSLEFATKAQRATEYSMKQAFKAAGFTVEFKPTAKSIETYKAVAAAQVGLIKSIPEKYFTDVQSVVWQAVQRGGDLRTLSEGLVKTYHISERRAALIARDQNNKANAVIENTRRQELGIKQAVWQHSAAGQEKYRRPTHVAATGTVYDLDKGFYDPDANGKGKGEWIWPGQLINCRCGSRSIIPGFAEIEAKHRAAAPAKRGVYTHEVMYRHSDGDVTQEGQHTSEAHAQKRASLLNHRLSPSAKAKGARAYVQPI